MENQNKTSELDIGCEINYRDIIHPRIEFKTGRLQLILPKDYECEEKILEKYQDWIHKKSSMIREALTKSHAKRLEKRTDKDFKQLVKSLVFEFSDNLDLNLNDIYFKKMKTKWGSCSSKRNLTINTEMKYLPKNLIRYVIFHEMTHLIERRHNENFWNIISNRFKNFEKYEKDLLIYWFIIQRIQA